MNRRPLTTTWTICPVEQSQVLYGKNPRVKVLSELMPGQLIVIDPADTAERQSWKNAAKSIGVRISTGMEGTRLEIAIARDHHQPTEPMPRRGAVIDIVRACVTDEDGTRLVDLPELCGLTASQCANAVKKLSKSGVIVSREGRWYSAS
jgi:hypothetical protein